MLENNTSISNSTESSSRFVYVLSSSEILIQIIAWFTILSFAATLLLNGVHLVVYVIDASLRTPFNAYIANLCAAEVLMTLISVPGNFLRAYYGYWAFGSTYCTVMIYSSQVIASAVRYGHVLITINRLWAVTFPINYRQHHTRRVANLIIVATWIGLHALHLPVIIPGRMWPAIGECQNNIEFQYKAAITVELLGFTVPEILILIAYPFIAYKIRKRRKKNNQVNVQSSNATSGTNAKVQNSIGEEEQKRGKSHDHVLLLLVIAVFICWTPNHIYFLLVDSIYYWNNTYFAVQYLLQYANSWINPILFYVALGQFRFAINKLLHSCHA